MGLKEHQGQTRTERLIQAVDRLSALIENAFPHDRGRGADDQSVSPKKT